MSPNPPTSQLSQELIDQILDHVAADTNKQQSENLLQCALVSRSFRPRSQLHTFSFIDIHGDSKMRQEKIRALLDIIQNDLDIAHYIEELSLECTDYQYTWIFEDPAFIEVMKRISTSERPLRKLTLKADTKEEDGYETLRLRNPEPLRDKFFLPFIVSSITSLSLHRLLNIPIEVVTSCVHLIDLELLHVEWQECDPAKTFGPHIIHLLTLKHRLSRRALEKLLTSTSDGSASIIDMSQLKSFTVYTDELPDLAFEQQIVNATQDSLEVACVLTMNTPWNGIFHGSLDFQSSTSLRQLRAHVLFPEDSLVSLGRTLSTIHSASLENLFVEAKVAFRDLSPPEVVLDADWPAFCSEVARVMAMNKEPRFEFKLTYLYRNNTEIKLDDYKIDLDKRCQLIIAKLRREQLALLENDPRLSVALSYDLEYDPLYEFNWGEGYYE